MQKLKLGKYKVVIYAAAILLVGAGVLFTSITVAQGAEANRMVSEQSEFASLDTALESQTGTGIPDTAPVKAKPAANSTPAPMATPTPAVTTFAGITPGPAVITASTPGPEFITEQEAKDAYTLVAKEILGLKVNSKKLTASFTSEDAPHELWIVTGPDADASIDAISGEVFRISINDSKKYTGKKITLHEYENDPAYNYTVYEDPNNPYSKLAAKIVNSKLADGRDIEEVMVSATQFVWDNNSEGQNPDAKGTIQTDVCVIMETGRCYTLSFWGTKQLELRIFSSHPNKDACLWGYYYEDQAEEYSGHA